jgi:hypothetical protein
MTLITDKIQTYLDQLSEPLQAEVLHFVEYLLEKVSHQTIAEDKAWYSFSLNQAMSGMEEEEELYTLDDLKVRFS